MKILRKLWDGIELYLVELLFLLMMLTLTYSITSRFLFNAPVAYAEEVCRILFVWMCFIGFGYTTHVDKHIQLTLLKSRFPQPVQTVMEYMFDLLTIAVFIWMFIHSFEYLEFVSIRKSSSLQLPMSVYGVVLPISSAIMVIRVIERIIRRLMKVGTPKDVIEEDQA